jgi:glucose/arabinose dehydrogenase
MYIRRVNLPLFGSWRSVAWCCILSAASWSLFSAPIVLDSALQIRHVMNTGAGSFRLVLNPADGALYYLKVNGDLFRLNVSSQSGASTSTRLYTKSDHGIASAAGLAIGADGTIYVNGNTVISNRTISTVTKGVREAASGSRRWSILAQTEPYPGGARIFNHQMNGMVLSPDGASIFVNIGARTDHGEIQSDEGAFPGVREVGLTTILLKLPSDGTEIRLPNDREQLRELGYLYCEGLRNTYDLAFAPNGELFGVENGPDRDMPEELNWLRQGHHYGFPWRMGTEDNPQRFPAYVPAADKLLNPNYYAVSHGTYANDPAFPEPPAASFSDPVINVGPDADSIRDPQTGAVLNGSSTGQTISTFTAHRCPLGLSFDSAGAFGSTFTGDAFVVSWTPGQPAGSSSSGPFYDASEDLLHLQLTSLGTNYQVQATRIAAGFNEPVDTEIVGNKLYVLENGGSQGVWEITFPAAPRSLLSGAFWSAEQFFQITLHGSSQSNYVLEGSPNLFEWSLLTNYSGANTPLIFREPANSNQALRFYRARPR